MFLLAIWHNMLVFNMLPHMPMGSIAEDVFTTPERPHVLARITRDSCISDGVATELTEGRVRRDGGGGHGVTGPVHTFVKTDKHAHFKWGVRHHVGHQYAG